LASERVEVTATKPDTAIYSNRDRDVTPPVVLWPQQLGRVPAGVDPADLTMIEVVVNADGTVAQVRAQESPRTLDDAMMTTMSLSAAKSWIFRPAYKDGRPVRYRQILPVAIR
jgi:TonB-like protein